MKFAPEVEARFERIERSLEEAARHAAITSAINAETAKLAKENEKAIAAMTKNLDAFISESREGRKTLETSFNAFLQAMAGGKNGK